MLCDGKPIDINSMEETLLNLSQAINRLELTSNQNRADFCMLFKNLTAEILASLNSMEEKFNQFEVIGLGPKLDQILSHILASKEAATDQTGLKTEPNQARIIPKLKFPKFDGEKDDARVWISKCKTFFEFYPMAERQMVSYASFHMIGHAFKWFIGYVNDKGDFLVWKDFSRALINRFADTEYVDSTDLMKEFTELAQCDSVLEYMEEYEEIVIAIIDKFPLTSRNYLVGIFINGLKEEIKMKVMMFQPDTVEEAFRLARTCEAFLKGEEEGDDVLTTHS